MSIEKEMVIHGLKKRYDLVIVDSFGNPKILVECKQSNVKINEETFFQIMKYNLHLKVNHFFLTNGLGHFYLKTDSNNKTSIYEEIPNYSSI